MAKMKFIRFIKEYILPIAILSLLSIWALRKVLIREGMVNLGWDWGLLPFAEQNIRYLMTHFFAWNTLSRAGFENLFSFTLPFYSFLTLFTLFTGVMQSKVLLIVLLVGSGFSMWILCRSLKIEYFPSFLAALFYMFSPYVYSRLVAGHLQFVFGYALMPFLVYTTFRLFKNIGTSISKEASSGVNHEDSFNSGYQFRFTILSAMLLWIIGTSHIFIFLAFILLGLIFLFEIVSERKNIRKIILHFLLILLIFFLLGAYSFLPSIMQFGKQATWYATQHVFPRPLDYYKGSSVEIVDALRLYNKTQGLSTEFVFPLSRAIFPLWTIVSMLLPIAVFLNILLNFKIKECRLFLFIALIGVVLTSGTKNLLGKFIVIPLIAKIMPFFIAVFHNPNRLTVLTTLAYAILLAYFLQRSYPLLKKWKNNFSKAHFFPLSPQFLLLLPILIYAWPFLNGEIGTPTRFACPDQPYCLNVTPITPEFKKTYDFIKDSPGDFRIIYLPSTYQGYPTDYWKGERELFHIMGHCWPKADFLGKVTEPFPKLITSTLHQDDCLTTQMGKLLGLANVKYLIYTDYQKLTYFDPKLKYRNLKKNIEQQEDLVKIARFGKTTIYQNKNFQPSKIYVSTSKINIIEGELDSLDILMQKEKTSGQDLYFITDEKH